MATPWKKDIYGALLAARQKLESTMRRPIMTMAFCIAWELSLLLSINSLPLIIGSILLAIRKL
jgi:hypothetical protein